MGIRDSITAFLAVGVFVYAAGVARLQQIPGNATPANTPAAGPPDPAAVVFTTDTGLVLHAIKPASVTHYESAIVALQEALSSAEEPATRKLASGWRVYRAAELDAKSNALYVHVLQPVVPGADYRPSPWLDKLLAGAPADLLAKYRDSFAVAPTKLALVELANMAVAPVAKPTNGSPSHLGITQIK